jgi:type IV pilus assembly protein PilA
MGLTMSAMARNLPPEMTQLFQALSGQNKYSMMTAYGEERAIRVTSNNQQMNMVVPLLVAAVAIPNLIRSRNAADAAGAAATLRTLNTSQAVYESTYSDKGFAPDLATLGPGPGGSCDGKAGSATHACIVDSTLGCASGQWCVRDGFQFNITGACDKDGCHDYVVVGTPSDPSKGNKSFCSTSDMVVRSKPGPPLTEPISIAECQTWQPL